MRIGGCEYPDIELTAETLIRIGPAAAPVLENLLGLRELTQDDHVAFMMAYAALIMGTSPQKAAKKLARNDELFGAAAQQLAVIIDRSPLKGDEAGKEERSWQK